MRRLAACLLSVTLRRSPSLSATLLPCLSLLLTRRLSHFLSFSPSLPHSFTSLNLSVRGHNIYCGHSLASSNCPIFCGWRLDLIWNCLWVCLQVELEKINAKEDGGGDGARKAWLEGVLEPYLPRLGEPHHHRLLLLLVFLLHASLLFLSCNFPFSSPSLCPNFSLSLSLSLSLSHTHIHTPLVYVDAILGALEAMQTLSEGDEEWHLKRDEVTTQ
eukprot:COSAG05_NODE_3216_length_2234_cov_78.090870_1_plen_215_part_10